MSSTRTLEKTVRLSPKNAAGMISQRCLGIVLVRISVRDRHRQSPSTVGVDGFDSLVTPAGTTTDSEDWMFESGYLVFQDFQEENRQCFWNRTLVDSVNGIEYLGYVAPGTMLVGGNEYFLEAIRSAWARRVLKPPLSFVIARLGDVIGLEMQVISQTQFTPLPEALCLVISELNSDKETASLEIIFDRLQDRFSDMIVPNQDIVYVSLGKLIKGRKVYHTSEGYFIVTPETYHVTAVPVMPERPLLLTNEEAIQRLHGGQLLSSLRPPSTEMRTRSIQTNMDDVSLSTRENSPSFERNLNFLGRLERTGSLRLSRKEKHKSKENGSVVVRSESMRLSPEKSKSFIKDINFKSSLAHQDVEKGEKVSVFSKLFRRSTSKRRKSSKSPSKYATFSAQFPPLEWSDPNIIHYHSRSTQTLDGRRSSSSCRLRTMGSDSGLVSRLAGESDLHRYSMQRPMSSVAISSVAVSNGNADGVGGGGTTSATLSPSHNNSKSNGFNNGTLNNNTKNISAASSPPSMKYKTDSLTRLREQEKFHLRVRSSTLDTVSSPDNHPVEDPVPNVNTSATPLSPSRVTTTMPPPPPPTTTTTTSGLPVRKLHSHSCIVLQESPSAKRRTSSSSSKIREQSPASKTFSPSRTSTSSVSVAKTPALGTPTKIVNTDRPGSYVGSHHVNRMDEVKVKNTELRTAHDEYKSMSSRKLQNRWSVHGESGGKPVSGGPIGGSATMNNSMSPSKKASVSNNQRYPSIKCVNKLHSSGSPCGPSSSAKHSSNVTAAVRPTQAIRPLTQTDTKDIDVVEEAPSKSVADVQASQMTPSLSFNKSFDIESSAFKSITAQKLLKGASINSIDTLVEVNMAAEKSSDDNSAASSVLVGRRISSSSTSSSGQPASYRTKVLNNSASVPSSSIQGRIVGQAHKVVPTASSEGSENQEESFGDLKKPNNETNGSGVTTKVMAVV